MQVGSRYEFESKFDRSVGGIVNVLNVTINDKFSSVVIVTFDTFTMEPLTRRLEDV